MPDTALLSSIATQLMTDSVVEVDGKRIPVRRTSAHRFKMVSFTLDGRHYQAIEQNAEKPSRWGQLAREGHQVVQQGDAGHLKVGRQMDWRVHGMGGCPPIPLKGVRPSVCAGSLQPNPARPCPAVSNCPAQEWLHLRCRLR